MIIYFSFVLFFIWALEELSVSAFVFSVHTKIIWTMVMLYEFSN